MKEGDRALVATGANSSESNGMNKRLTESELCSTAWGLLNERLGPAEAMRFFSLIRNPSRDYQEWRARHFKDLTIDQLVEGIRPIERAPD